MHKMSKESASALAGAYSQVAKYREIVDVLLEHINWTQCGKKQLTCGFDIHDAVVMLEDELINKFNICVGYSITGKVKLEEVKDE